MTKDMTSGNPLKLIIGFAIPMFLGMLFQQFYSMVDTVIVGKFLGVGPLAGVGSTSSLNFLVIGFCTGVCNGFAIPVSQMFGATFCCKQRMAVRDFFRRDHDGDRSLLSAAADADAYAGGYF